VKPDVGAHRGSGLVVRGSFPVQKTVRGATVREGASLSTENQILQ